MSQMVSPAYLSQDRIPDIGQLCHQWWHKLYLYDFQSFAIVAPVPRQLEYYDTSHRIASSGKGHYGYSSLDPDDFFL
jgi:hypothetical protein